MTHLEIIIIMALVPMGAFVAMGEGMVLRWFGRLVLPLPSWLRKPLSECPRCMVSAWGIPAVYLLGYAPEPWLLPVYLLAAAGLQELIDRL